MAKLWLILSKLKSRRFSSELKGLIKKVCRFMDKSVSMTLYLRHYEIGILARQTQLLEEPLKDGH